MSLHTLYRFFDVEGRLLYVGITCNPSARMTKHRNTKDWWARVAEVRMDHFPSRDELLLAERSAIQAEKPAHNIRMNGNGRQAGSSLPCGLVRNRAYAFGLVSGTCPVGLVNDGSPEGVRITLFSWLTGMFCLSEQWIANGEIKRWVKAGELPRGYDGWEKSCVVFDMEPLGAFQREWKLEGVEHAMPS